jgi:hypothetical protein
MRSIVLLIAALLVTTIAFPSLGAQDCLSEEVLYNKFAERDGEVSRYLPQGTQAAFLAATCVLELGRVLTDGKGLQVRWVGTLTTGRWYQIEKVESATDRLIDGIVTDPPKPVAIRVKLLTLMDNELQLWYFPTEFRLLEFYDNKRRSRTTYVRKPQFVWALKAADAVVLLRPTPTGWDIRVLPPTPSPGQELAIAMLYIQRYRPLITNFQEDSSWLP